MAAVHQLFLLMLGIASSLAARGVILPPVKEAATQAALIITPGANISGEAYRPLALKIQQASPLKLWVALLEDFVIYNPDPLELPGAISSVIGQLRQQGMTSDNYFLAGHSLGGVFVGQYGTSHASQLKGILLFASYLTRDVPLHSYPLPVLHISGDLDGQTRVTRIVDTFQQLQASQATDPQSQFRTPVVVMAGVNHAQFASGPMPKAVVDKDLPPEVTSQAAYALIANHSSAFMVSALGQQVAPALLSEAKADLAAAYHDTAALLAPLITVKTMEQNGQHSDAWVVTAQRMLAGLASNFGNITDEVVSETTNFLATKPSLHVTGSHVLSVHTFAHLTFDFNPFDISTNPSAPRELAYKMKSREAVQRALNDSGLSLQAPGVHQEASSLSCKDLSEAAFTLALKTASPAARKRYQGHGRTLFFNDDHLHASGLTWSTSSLDLRENDLGLYVTSQALQTALDAFPSLFAGMHYCKGLSPYRAMEWIYVDSLRKHAI